MSSSHIVALRDAQSLIGFQLRFNGGGPGQTKYFSARQCGSPDKARKAARAYARSLGLPKARPRGGSSPGRVFSTSTTGAAGLRFEWTPNRLVPVLRVVATWVDKRGRSRHTSFSVQRNGLEGALDLAIAARPSAGGPSPITTTVRAGRSSTGRAGAGASTRAVHGAPSGRPSSGSTQSRSPSWLLAP